MAHRVKKHRNIYIIDIFVDDSEIINYGVKQSPMVNKGKTMLIKLMQGVRQFQNHSFPEMRDLFSHLSLKQEPEILFITCSDSRLDPALITQTKPGELFIMRNVGNIIPPSSTGSSESAALEFSLEHLQSIKDIIICGHADCGAMKGLMNPNLKTHLPNVASWLTHAQEAAKTHEHDPSDKEQLHQLTMDNIKLQLKHLTSYPAVVKKLENKRLAIHGWFYEFESGTIFVLDQNLNEFISFDAALEQTKIQHRNQVVERVALEYLAAKSQPQSVSEYQDLMRLFFQLEDNVLPIWDQIKQEVYETLWLEMQGLFWNKINEFEQFVTQGALLQLHNLKRFQPEVSISSGYKDFLHANLRSLFFNKQPFIDQTDSGFIETLSPNVTSQ